MASEGLPRRPLTAGRRAGDASLGMDRPITRRDFLHGVAGGGLALALGCGEQDASTPPTGPVGTPARAGRDAAHYPPLRTGLRGSHPGSFEVAHAMAQHGMRFEASGKPDTGEYDLVVVGAGISGLAAAFFHRRAHPGARVLILDNHDDFGGHAKRNEFTLGGRTILGYGGSQSLEAPGAYSEVARGLLEALGAEPARLHRAYHHGFFARHDLAPAFFFDRAHYGVDRVVPYDFDTSLFLPLARAPLALEESIARMPLPEAARDELRGLVRGGEDRLPEPFWREPARLARISYRELLVALGIRREEVFALFQQVPAPYFGVGIDAVPADLALGFGLPGLGHTGLRRLEEILRWGIHQASESYTYHFPDGNASVARLLVRALAPRVAEGSTLEDVVTATFDYAQLDRDDADVRIRLSSTVVDVRHDGPVGQAERVLVSYVRGGPDRPPERVRAKQVVLACWGAALPYICPELPEAQRAALREQVKMPLVYTNVLLRDWTAWKRLGLGLALCPGSWHSLAMLDFPVSLGDYAFSPTPEDPIVLHMQRVPGAPGLPPKAQFRAGRTELLATSFETIERETRIHLAGMLGAGGFDPARDVAAITVNRWPHGYAWSPNPLFDPEYAPGEAPYERGRARLGRIAIANSDAGGRAYLDEAIDQAWRAVGELEG